MQCDISTLKVNILKRFKSIHAFCTANPEVTRSTVYQVLSGKYAGQFHVQAKRILDALNGENYENLEMPTLAPLTKEEILNKLQEYKCSQCRRLDTKICHGCKTQTIKEAFAMYEYIYVRRT